jgi:RNA ligase
MPEFIAWPKIPRGANENICITEKMDGSNACVIIDKMEDTGQHYIGGVQSRKRLIYPNLEVKDGDNFGFAQWVADNNHDLLKMGEGYHYGEWTGEGIQKNPHGLKGRTFYLFNSARWNDQNPNRPDCCSVVPVLYTGNITPDIIEITMDELFHDYVGRRNETGSLVKPEGIVVWYSKTRRFEKYTFETPDGKWTS